MANLQDTTRDVYRENVRMAEALRYHVEEGAELEKHNKELSETNRALLHEKDLQNIITKEKVMQSKVFGDQVILFVKLINYVCLDEGNAE